MLYGNPQVLEQFQVKNSGVLEQFQLKVGRNGLGGVEKFKSLKVYPCAKKIGSAKIEFFFFCFC